MRKVIGTMICIMVLLFGGFSREVIAKGETLDVVLRDELFRKILIKDGSTYMTNDELYIELPMNIFDENKVYEIKIESIEKESGEVRDYNFYYKSEIP